MEDQVLAGELGRLEQELRSVSKALAQTNNAQQRIELSKLLKRLKQQCQDAMREQQRQTPISSDRHQEALFAGEAGLIEEEMRRQYALLATTDDARARADINSRMAVLKAEFLKSIGEIRKISPTRPSAPSNTASSRGVLNEKDALEALLRAVSAGNTQDVRDILNDKHTSVEVDSRDASGWSALHYASLIGWTEVTNCLIGMKADVNAVNDLGGSPLHLAVEMENRDMIQLLLDHRADPLVEDIMCCHPFSNANPDLIRAFRKSLPSEMLPVKEKDDEPWEVDLAELEYGPMLGSGAAADVYRGIWREADVAIKEITWAKARETEDKVAEFKQELEIVINLRHPNLVLFMGAFTKSRPLRLVTELCDGGPLSSVLYARKDLDLTWQQRHKICSDTAKGIFYLHTNNPLIIHRDLKSQNLLLAHPLTTTTSVPIVKIADFGIAFMKHRESDLIGSSSSSHHHQHHGGTWAWMAPEILSEDESCDHQVDIYSFAICMYEIITRTRPYCSQPHLTPIAIAINVSTGMRPDINLVPEGCPPLLRELMVDCWHGDPSGRPTAKTVCQRLRDM